MKSGMQWPIGIVAILASSVAGNIAFMNVAKNDPAFAVEPDYYRKAVAFDTTMDEARQSLALGWSATANITAKGSDAGTIALRLVDRTGSAILADSVRAQALFVARANDVTDTLLARSQDALGLYTTTLAKPHKGLWEIRVWAYRGTDRFVSTIRTSVE